MAGPRMISRVLLLFLLWVGLDFANGARQVSVGHHGEQSAATVSQGGVLPGGVLGMRGIGELGFSLGSLNFQPGLVSSPRDAMQRFPSPPHTTTTSSTQPPPPLPASTPPPLHTPPPPLPASTPLSLPPSSPNPLR